MPRGLDPTGGPHGQSPSDARRLADFLSSRELSSGYVRNNLSFNRYDAGTFAELVASDEALSSIARAAGAGGGKPSPEVPPTFAALLFDLFLMYFKFVPEFVGDGETDPACLKANRPILERLLGEEETMLARLGTATDETASALATAEAAKRLLDELRRRPYLAEWMRRQAEPAPQGHTPPESSPAPGETADPTPDGDPAPAADLGTAARAVADAASTEADRHAAALASWGLKPADLSRAPLGERLDLARALRTKRLKDLADLLGRMKNQRTSQRRKKVRANRDEIHAVGTSGEISRVLPAELACAFGTRDPRREMDFFRRLSERSVPSYSLRTEEPVGRGPVVALIDCSYSMSGEPMAWASAVALTLAQVATRQASARTGARPVTAVFFNTQIVLEVAIDAGERDPRKFLSVATVAADGGTDYDRPLSRALEVLEGRSTPGGAAKRARPRTPTSSSSRTAGASSARPSPPSSRGARRLWAARWCASSSASTPPTGSLEPHADRLVAAADLARASGGRDAAARVFDAL